MSALAAQREAKVKPGGPCTQKARVACSFISGGGGWRVNIHSSRAIDVPGDSVAPECAE